MTKSLAAKSILALILFPASISAQELGGNLLGGFAKQGAEKAQEFSRHAPELMKDFIGTGRREFGSEKECLSEIQLLANAGVALSNTMPFSHVWTYETVDGPTTRARILFNGEKVHTEVYCDGSDLIAEALDWDAQVPDFLPYNNGTLNAALGAWLILSERGEQGLISENKPGQGPKKQRPASSQEPQATENFFNDALSNALAGALERDSSNDLNADAEENSSTSLKNNEKNAIQASIQRCWNVGSLSSEALRTMIVVEFDIDNQGRPNIDSISLIDGSGGNPTAVRQAFEAARRAIIRCGQSGFELPAKKNGTLQTVRLSFDPEGMIVH
ncbi:hypothetical protein SAMN05443999_10845 [Roseovarius azorensis]|uniref:TonB C-terminal domain-containing protein n=1 Tax=Roseovarius azorensis TaxID=1287727 RepID=A0A1H7T2V6_9RHOB|nr:hypothetical protein [Roseovarius azorensis]SEL79191.1 hypothetical protein SAMN05443999_10845 [Roseovarius azorensis]